MQGTARRPLAEYLATEYPFQVIADREDGGYVIRFPDLPGCVSQTDDVRQIGAVAEEIRCLWIETEYEAGADIPLPSYPEEYSGKFNVRVPKSLHRALAEAAERDSVSLNQHVVNLLSQGNASHRFERRLDALEATLRGTDERHHPHENGSPTPVEQTH